MMNYYENVNEDDKPGAVRRFLINAECRYVLYLKLYNSQPTVKIIPPWAKAFQDVDRHSEMVWNTNYPNSTYVLSNYVDLDTVVFYDCPFCHLQVKIKMELFEVMSVDPSHKQGYPCPNCAHHHCSDSLSSGRFVQDFWEATNSQGYQLSGHHFDRLGSPLGYENLQWFVRTTTGSETSFGILLNTLKVSPAECNWEIIGQSFKQFQKELRFRTPLSIRPVSKAIANSTMQLFLKSFPYYRGYIHPFSIALPAAVLRQRLVNEDHCTNCYF
ncbi:hypothetical protein HDV02_004813 [Globomyces sp. JEL0801]|nr:hypothetical protein HDV02_004813 [Globomyces sp. JEL0801]